MKESFDDVAREYISFVNEQVGMYMDALAGFAGHCVRTQRQIHRALRPSKGLKTEQGCPVTVWNSYEDPKNPDIIHNSIVRAGDYVETNSPGGSNEQKLTQSIIVFLFTYWEDEIRPRLATAEGVEQNDICSDIMGDIRILRNTILHTKSILRAEKHKRLTKLSDMFAPDQPLTISYEDMHRIFALVKQGCAQLMFEWLGVKESPVSLGQISDVAIQKRSQIEGECSGRML